MRVFLEGMTVHKDFITDAEEKSILDEIEPYLKRMRYEFDHWDDVSRFVGLKKSIKSSTSLHSPGYTWLQGNRAFAVE